MYCNIAYTAPGRDGDIANVRRSVVIRIQFIPRNIQVQVTISIHEFIHLRFVI